MGCFGKAHLERHIIVLQPCFHRIMLYMVRRVDFSSFYPAVWDKAASLHKHAFPFSTYAWHKHWQNVFGEEGENYTLLVDNKLIAPFLRIHNTLNFSGGKEISDYMDILGPNELKAQAWEKILEYIEKDGVKNIEFSNIPESSASAQFFDGNEKTQEDTTPFFQLPKTWDEYLRMLNKHSRHELRRKLRKFENEHEGLTIVESPQPQKDIDELLRLMKFAEGKQQFLTPQMETFFRGLPSVFPTSISLLFLQFDSKNIAATLSFITDTELLLYNSGADLAQYPVSGFYLKAHSIKWAINRKLKIYNFLQGNERYKYDLGGKDFVVYTVKKSLVL